MSERLSRRALIGSAGALAAVLAVGRRHAVHAQETGGRGTPAAQGPGAPRRFKLGMVTYNFAADWDLKTLIGRCKKAGIAAVEPRTTHKHGIEPALSKDQRRDVRRQFEDAGVVIWCLGSVCEFHSPDPAVVAKNIEDARAWIELAHDLGAKGVKVRPNGLPKEVEEAKTLDQIGQSLRKCGEMAEPAGVEIMCEVHGSGTSEPARMRKLMDIAQHPAVGVTWNSNGTDVKNGSVKESFELLKPFIKSCHINDLLSGYPYRELFTLFRQAGYDRYTEMEFNPALESKSDRDNLLFLKYYKGMWDELSRA